MTKELLEKLRNEHREQTIKVFNKNADWYKRFAEKISKGELLTDNDWKEMNEETLIYIKYVNENGENDEIELSWLFSKGFEDELLETIKQ